MTHVLIFIVHMYRNADFDFATYDYSGQMATKRGIKFPCYWSTNE